MVLSTLWPIAAVSAGVGGVGLLWNSRRQRGPTLEERFQTWVMASDEVNSDLKTWIADLSDQEIKILVNQLVLHCAEVGMEVEWLLGEELNNQELRTALQDTVVAYLASRLSAAQAAEDAYAFKVYQAFDKKPKKHQELASQLYAKLVDEGVIAVSTENLLETSNKKRQQHIVNTIRETSADKPEAFHQALKAVVRDMNSSKQTSSEPAPTPEPAPAPPSEEAAPAA